MAPVAEETEELESAEAMTVEGAWAAYDLAEREMWDEYAADPTYLNGKIYLAGEQLMRRRSEKRVQSIRYRQDKPKPEPVKAPL